MENISLLAYDFVSKSILIANNFLKVVKTPKGWYWKGEHIFCTLYYWQSEVRGMFYPLPYEIGLGYKALCLTKL